MRLNLANNAGSKLSKDITAASTTIEVDSAASFPVAPFLLTLARSEEIVKVTAVTGNALTVERAQEGTTAKAYLSGTDVWHNFTSGTYEALADKEYVDRKIEDIPQPDLTGYATKQEVSTNATEISTVKQTVTTHLAEKATKTTFGHVQVGTGINVTNGVISVAETTATNISTTDGSNVQSEIDTLKSSVSDGKNQVETAITGKGGAVSKAGEIATFAELVNGVNGIDLASLLPGEVLLASSDAETHFYGSTNWVKLKEIQVLKKGGSIRVKFDLRSYNSGRVTDGKIYVNGVAVGISRNVTSTTPTTFTEDIDVNVGDLIQFYGRTSDTAYNAVKVSNFRLYGSNEFVTFKVNQ